MVEETFRREGVLFGAPTRDLRYMTFARLFAVGSAVHLLLPDALQDAWLAADALYWIGLFLLAITGSLAGWILCAVGLAVPLFFLGDQLTQSAFLLTLAVSAIVCFGGPARDREVRLTKSLPAAVRTLTVATYAVAALHKMNVDFFDPAVSCANAGVSILANTWTIDFIANPSLDTLWAPFFVVVELGVATLLVVRPAMGMTLALAMHIPLTIVFAPAFAFTMIAGWPCFLTEDELDHLGRVMRRSYKPILALGAVLGLGSFALYMQRHTVVYWFWSFKEGVLWTLLAWLAVALAFRPKGVFDGWSATRESVGRHGRVLSIAVAAFWVVHALGPYTGMWFHHSGAMLSNLRIDEGCWNSALFGESARLVDPYVRIDEARVTDVSGMRQPGREEGLVAKLRDRRELERERARVCHRDGRVVRLHGTFEGAPFQIANLCETPWPLGRPLFPGARPFQRNLERECPQACIH